jgi:hypothetical protein
LLLLFSFPLISPLFAVSPAEANLPACCRKDGKHHCMILQGNSETGGDVRVSVVRGRCPYCPTLPATPHVEFFPDARRRMICADVVSHPAGVVQTEARLRISFDRSRKKRGPPTHQS